MRTARRLPEVKILVARRSYSKSIAFYAPFFKRLASMLYDPGPTAGAVLPTVWPKVRGERLYIWHINYWSTYP